MKQLITCSFLLITVLVHAQKKDSVSTSWYVSMIGINLSDTTIYLSPKGKSEIRLGDLLEQKFQSRFYIRNPKPYYVSYENHSLFLYKSEKERKRRAEPIIVEYILNKNQLILIEQETSGISAESGLPVYEKLTVLTKIYDTLSWNKNILGCWNNNSTTPFSDLKTGDTCKFQKTTFQEENQLRFDLNAGFSTCKIKENPNKVPMDSNGVLDGVYMLEDKRLAFSYGIDLEKNQLTLLGNFETSFKIVELTDNNLILIKQ